MDKDIQKEKQLETTGFLARESVRSDFDPNDRSNSGTKTDRILKTADHNVKIGSTLDEELIKVRGNNSFILVVSSIMVSFAFAEIIVFGVPFLELIPPLECNINGSWIPCLKEQACDPEIEYRLVMDDKYSLENWVEDLQLVCRTEWEVGIIGSAWFVGMFVGAITLSPIADIFGRRPVHIAGLVLSLIGGLWMYVFPTWFSVIISLVFKGVGMYSRLSISYLYTLEMFDEERCVLVATIIMSVNNALSSIMALYFMFGGRDATFFLLCSIFIVMYSLIFVPILPESPKLLYSQKKYEETREWLSVIAHVNGLKYKKVIFEDEASRHVELAVNDEQKLKEIEAENNKKGEFRLLFTKYQYLVNMGIIIFVFMFNVFSMYMLSFMLKYLPGDKYVNLFLLGLADFIPSVMSGVFMSLFQTKRAMILVHGSIWVFVVLHMLFGGIEFLGMPLIFFIRFAITLESWLNFYVVYEYFPAKFSSVVYGGCNIAAGLASILSPMAVEIFASPLLIVLIMGGICTFLCTLLIPGTKNLV